MLKVGITESQEVEIMGHLDHDINTVMLCFVCTGMLCSMSWGLIGGQMVLLMQIQSVKIYSYEKNCS